MLFSIDEARQKGRFTCVQGVKDPGRNRTRVLQDGQQQSQQRNTTNPTGPTSDLHRTLNYLFPTRQSLLRPSPILAIALKPRRPPKILQCTHPGQFISGEQKHSRSLELVVVTKTRDRSYDASLLRVGCSWIYTLLQYPNVDDHDFIERHFPQERGDTNGNLISSHWPDKCEPCSLRLRRRAQRLPNCR